MVADPAAERLRTRPEVDDSVEHLAQNHAYKLPLRRADLIVEPPKYPFGRSRMIVLNEGGVDPRPCEPFGAVGLHEETAPVGVDLGVDEYDVRDVSRSELHGRGRHPERLNGLRRPNYTLEEP